MVSKKIDLLATFKAAGDSNFYFENILSSETYYQLCQGNKVTGKFDRFSYDTMFNISEQQLTCNSVNNELYFNFQLTEQVCTQSDLQTLFKKPNSWPEDKLHFADVFSVVFLPKDKTSSGSFSISLKPGTQFNGNAREWTILFPRNAALIFGIETLGMILKDGKESVLIKIEQGTVQKYIYDLSRSVNHLSLRSAFVSLSTSEICFKQMSKSELNFLCCENELTISNLSSREFLIESKQPPNWSFFF